MKLIDKKKRSVLGEGRNFGMGFAFCKKDSDDTFSTVQPISPCKDYLNDVVWSEAVDKSISAYGLSYKKQGIFDGERAYMVISIMEYFGGGKYNEYDADYARLKKGVANLVKFMNWFEKKLKLEVLTEIEEVEENKYFITFSHYWCKGTYLISLYSLLLRVGQFYSGKGLPSTYLKNFKDFPADTYILNGALPKLNKLLEGGYVEQDMTKLSGGTSVHNLGIIGFNM